MFNSSIGLLLTRDEEDLLETCTIARSSRLDAPLDRVDHQRSLLAITDVEPRPRRFRQGRTPMIHTHERSLGGLTPPPIFRWRCLQIADRRVRRNRQQILLPPLPQRLAKTRGTAHFIVPRHPRVWQQPTLLIQHRQGQLMARLELDGLGDASLVPAVAILGPFLGQVKPYIGNRMLFSRRISHVDANLTVLNLPQPAAPLPRDAHRHSPFLGEARRVEDNHPILLAQLLADLLRRIVSRG